MSFKLLKQVIAHLQRQTKCPSCGSRFPDDLIFILGTGVSQTAMNLTALFMIVCPECGNQALVFAEAAAVITKIKNEMIRMHTKPLKDKITMNDVLDMKNFLKNWQGDVKRLFEV